MYLVCWYERYSNQWALVGLIKLTVPVFVFLRFCCRSRAVFFVSLKTRQHWSDRSETFCGSKKKTQQKNNKISVLSAYNHD